MHGDDSVKKQFWDALRIVVPVIGSVLVLRGLADVFPELSGWNAVGAGIAVTLVGVYYLGAKK